MEHFYSKLKGENWFNYENFYSFIIDNLPEDSKMVEVGSWIGRSISYFAVESIRKNKNITCFCVDIWKPYKEIPSHHLFENDKIYDEFIKNIMPVKHIIEVRRGYSQDISKEFEDGYFDFIFIDAAHDYENVMKDIISWYPKLSPNGIIAGHDYDYKDVHNAVKDFFQGKPIKSMNTCWYVEFGKS